MIAGIAVNSITDAWSAAITRRAGAGTSTSGDLPATSAMRSVEDEQQVKQLKQRDQAVRTHEQAHQAAGGSLVGGASYQYRKGPDGKAYAVGGEVPVDASPVKGDPQATVAKMEKVRAAALAPSDPSGQDQAVAAQATAEEAKARTEQTQQTSRSPGKSSPERQAANAYSAQGSTQTLGSSCDINV